MEFENHNHLNVLKQFLQSVRLPGLQKLSIYLHQRLFIDLPIQALQSINQAMEIFLQRHGQQLLNLKCNDIPLRALKLFQYLSNLETLEFSFNQDFNEEGIGNGNDSIFIFIMQIN